MNPYNKKNEGAIAGPGQLSYSFEHLHMEKPRAWKTMDGVRLSSMLFTRLKDISTPEFSTPSLNPGTFQPRLFNPGLFNHEFLNHGVEKSKVEKSGLKRHLSRRLKDISTPDLGN